MANTRILKKWHTRYLADFMTECTYDAAWEERLKNLKVEDKLNTAELGFPEEFTLFFPETQGMNLQYCLERVELKDIPRSASCWWPTSENTHFFMAYPAQFPQSPIYMAIDFHGDHAECC